MNKTWKGDKFIAIQEKKIHVFKHTGIHALSRTPRRPTNSMHGISCLQCLEPPAKYCRERAEESMNYVIPGTSRIIITPGIILE